MEDLLLTNQHKAGKSKLFLIHYEQHFRRLRDQKVQLLELGIDKGGSLLMWRDYFRTGTIVGLDLEHVEINDTTGKIHVYQGNQRDLSLLNRIGHECAPAGFDIIIDDASHIGEITSISFWHLFTQWLKPGGLYVIEDWRTGYSDGWPDGGKYKFRNAKKTWASTLLQKFTPNGMQLKSHSCGMVGFIKQLVDELGMDAITSPVRGGKPPQLFPRFRQMEIYPGQVFILKAAKEDDELLAEQWG